MTETLNVAANNEVSLNVKFVPNEKVGERYVLCWAACVAMGANYVKSKNYTAMDIKNLIGTWNGVPSAIIGAFQMCGCPVNRLERAATADEVKNSLLNGKPVYASLRDKKNPDDFSHAVEVYKIEIGTNQTKYTFYDPSILSGAPETSTVTSSDPDEPFYKHGYSGYNNGAEVEMEWYATYIMK